MKFLVTGSAGLIGRQVIQDLVDENKEVFSLFHERIPDLGTPVKFDLSQIEKIPDLINKIKPDVIIHLAALTNVDLCETDKNLAQILNEKSTEIIAKESSKLKSFLVYVSTDYVFDGTLGLRKETDETNPINYYGLSKLNGEKAVINNAYKWAIGRISTPFGFHLVKRNFPWWILNDLLEGKKVNGIVDQFTTPSYVPNTSKMINEISQNKIEGLFHLACKTRISRFEFAKMAAKKLNLDTDLITPISIEDTKKFWKALRPKDSSFDCSKAQSLLREKPMDADKALDLFISDLTERNQLKAVS